MVTGRVDGYKYSIALVMLVTACGAADTDDSLWTSNPVGGGDAFTTGGSSPTPTATGTGTSAPTSTGTVNPTPTDTSMPIPTTTGTVPTPTATTTTTAVPTTTSTTTATGEPIPTPTGNSGPCALQLDFTTVSYGGRYAPRHVEAAWIESGTGQFIQTLEQYGVVRAYNLVTWNAKSAGNKVDAVTGATIPLHRAHTVTWDCVDLQNNPVPDGNYKVVAEFTEDNSGGFFGPPSQLLTVDFTKSAQPADITIADTATYRAVHLVFR